MPAKSVEDRDGVVVEVEVGVDLPAADHVGRARPRAVGIAAHPADDVLREGDPDLLVVDELGVRAQILEGGKPRSLVPIGSSSSPCAAPTRR